MRNLHEAFWRVVIVLMLIALVGVAYLAYELRPRPSLATELARNYKPQPQSAAAPEPAASETKPAPLAPVPASPSPTASRPAASTSAGLAATPLRRFLPSLRGGLDEGQLNLQLGVVLASLSRHEEAVRAYATAADRAPQNAASWIGLGVSFEALGKRREALDAYRRALTVRSIEAEDRAFAERRVKDLQ